MEFGLGAMGRDVEVGCGAGGCVAVCGVPDELLAPDGEPGELG